MSGGDSIYSRLGHKSIRLLEIIPALPDEQIECALITVHNIEEAPDFEALSYVWGETTSPDPIICNGVSVTVTQNLEDALRHLRPLPEWESVQAWPTKHELHSSRHAWRSFARNRYEQQKNMMSLQKPVWVDAICINQGDFVERAAQIKLMGKIYQTASTVKIWLGKEKRPVAATSVTSNEAGSLLGALTQYPNSTQSGADPYSGIQGGLLISQVRRIVPRHHMETYGSTPIVLTFLAQALRNMDTGPSNLASLRPLQDSAHRNLVYGLPPPSAREWEIFRQFLSNPWFRRIWIVQEVVLARKAIVVLGNWHINWDAVGRAITWFESKGYAMPRTMKYILHDLKDLLPVAHVAELWQMHELPNKRVPLLGLLKDFRSRDAVQGVDKIYAALGLAQETASDQEEFPALLEPDYNKSLQDVYRDLAIFLIIEHGSLFVLSHVDRSPTQSTTWPTWVPDWRLPKASSEIWAGEQSSFCADGNEPLSLSFEQDFNGLLLEGLQVDVVRFYGDKLKSYGFGFETYLQELEFVEGAWNLAKASQTAEHTSHQVAPDHLHTFISTLLARDQGGNLEGVMDDAAQWMSKHLSNQFPHLSPKWFGSKRGDAGRFHEALVRVCTDKRFFITRDGRMGIGPESMKEGDEVAILFGAKVPFLVRRLGPRYTLIGECYVAGMMKGEPVERWKKSGGSCRRFNIH
ncbi:heterokaryon incompatibility protein-domain-containing protein [Xylaria grammica]|nr:heterokaryon incompatibility protein-domain-containing protein [Xylaria grammica]